MTKSARSFWPINRVRWVRSGAVLIFISCMGDRQPPITAGLGLRIEDLEDRRDLSADPAHVPVVESCLSGHSPQRTDDGWVCGELLSIEEARLVALETTAAQTAGSASMLLSTATRLDEDIRDLSRLPAFGLAAATCVIDEASTVSGNAARRAGRVVHLGVSAESVKVYCPIVAARKLENYTIFTISYLDPDGAQAGTQVRATLNELNDLGVVVRVTGGEFDSNSSSAVTPASPILPIVHTFDFDARSYFLEVEILRAAGSPEPAFIGFRLK